MTGSEGGLAKSGGVRAATSRRICDREIGRLINAPETLHPSQENASVQVVREPTKLVLVIMFSFGLAQFFVYPEPGVPELLFPILLIYLTRKSLLHPVHLLLLGGNLFAIVAELLVFGHISWSAISIYLTLTSIALYSILTRFERDTCLKALLLGASAGAALTLLAAVGPVAHDVIYRYGIRFTGFFKDPNVTAPTALFFAVAILAYRGRWRLLAILPFTVFLISLSRASYLAAGVGLLYALSFRNRTRAIFGVILTVIAVLFVNRIIEAIDLIFREVGRQGLVNYYDSDRSSNWLELLRLALDQGAPLGPGFSEANGMSVHSTYLRLLVEQGLPSLVMFVAALWISWRGAQSIAVKTALLCLIVNGFVIDATHWRVLFVAIPIALAWAFNAHDSQAQVPRRATAPAWSRYERPMRGLPRVSRSPVQSHKER